MPLFTSSREKRLWLYALSVLVAIVLTLVFARPLVRLPYNEETLTPFFMLAMILIGATFIAHGLKTRPDKTEISIWLGLSAVYILLFIRLGHPAERTHLMEYSVLAIFIHKALIERLRQENLVLKPALIAFAVTLIIGVLDEGIQIFIPDRVFDPLDVLFNSLAAFMAIGGCMVLQWARKKFRK